MNLNINNMPSNKKFGKFFCFILCILSIYFYIYSNYNLSIFFSLLLFITILITFFAPNYLKPFNLLWFKIGSMMNFIVSPFILGIIFFCIISPISILFKLIGRDELKLKYKNKSTFLFKNKTTISNENKFKNQF